MITPNDIRVTHSIEDSPWAHTRVKGELYVITTGMISLSPSFQYHDEAVTAAKKRAKQEVWGLLYGDLLTKAYELRVAIDGLIVTTDDHVSLSRATEVREKVGDLIEQLQYPHA